MFLLTSFLLQWQEVCLSKHYSRGWQIRQETVLGKSGSLVLNIPTYISLSDDLQMNNSTDDTGF